MDRDDVQSGEPLERKISIRPKGTVRLNAANFSYNGFTWSPVEADIRMRHESLSIQITKADLCGISTTGEIGISPQGLSLHITPSATDASLQQTAECIWPKPVEAEVRYDLTGEVNLPVTRQNPIRFMTGRMEFSSQNGRIAYSSILMKIFSVLNVTEVFAGGTSDLTENGYGYSTARVAAAIGGGKIHFNEIAAF